MVLLVPGTTRLHVTLVGRFAPSEMLQMLTYLVLKHDTHVQRANMVRAYSLGALYFAERLISRSHKGHRELKGTLQLFDMGLELYLPLLEALAYFAFGMGLPQVLLSMLAFVMLQFTPSGVVQTKLGTYSSIQHPIW